jgi:hypothetical protein
MTTQFDLNQFQEKIQIGVNMFLSGSPKSGKTYLAGTLAKKHRLIWLDLENGLTTLFHHPDLTKEDKARIEPHQIKEEAGSTRRVDLVSSILTGNKVTFCREHSKVICTECSKAALPFSVIHLKAEPKGTILVIDSLSSWNDSAQTKGVNNTITEKNAFAKFTEWNRLLSIGLNNIQDAPWHVVVLGHLHSMDLDDGKTKLIPVGGTKAFSENIARFFSNIVYTDYKMGKFSVGVSADYDNRILLGNRSNIKWVEGKTKLSDFFPS